jgi:hypothetical protein
MLALLSREGIECGIPRIPGNLMTSKAGLLFFPLLQFTSFENWNEFRRENLRATIIR